MPEHGIQYLPKKELLTYEEMIRLVQVLVNLGVSKVRITGGEPFVRKNLIDFLTNLAEVEGLNQINITTNGVLTKPFIPRLKEIGISSVNLSIDTLDRDRFFKITRRDELPQVMESFHAFIEQGIPLKLNAVVMDGKNTEDILPMVELTKQYPVSVRFIEEMPFNGEGAHYAKLIWDHKKIIETIREAYPALSKIDDPKHSTSYNYSIPGHLGNIGVIAAFSRTFCGSCNRIRLTAQGTLKTCLYDDGVMNFRDLLRSGADDEKVEQEFIRLFGQRAKDGFEAEKRRSQSSPVQESMSTIGG